ncbi:cHC2 zinc finger domain protein [[Eubacterium] siraeum CAG:80]|uniref:CHC2 zinc finger domain protein n=1 Tax=[Eubacterium] siraeum CAG:80 TaxID=1263080 RepID=R6RL19_9FIRM|nr:cHC2 zinc finger domain protein [[Eubacterium] siraeum CAG:80]
MSYSKSKPSNYVTKEQIERARNVDMVEFLERTEGPPSRRNGTNKTYERSYNNFISRNYNTGIPHSTSEKRNHQARYCR